MSVLTALLATIGVILCIVLEVSIIVILVGVVVLLINLIISYIRDLWKMWKIVEKKSRKETHDSD